MLLKQYYMHKFKKNDGIVDASNISIYHRYVELMNIQATF